MGILDLITRQRNRFSEDLNSDRRYWSLSAITLSYYYIISPIIEKYVHGITLDAGAGRLNGKMLLEGLFTEYVSMDIDNINGKMQLVGDIQDMSAISDNSFDTVYSAQVLEHVQRPWDGLSEVYRVLKPGGCAIISVPLFNGLHSEPYDFYRFTPYGLRYLMAQAGFEIRCEAVAGGLFAFLEHIISLLFITIFWPIPCVRWLAYYFNKFIFVHPVILLDKLTRSERKFPACIVVVGQKP